MAALKDAGAHPSDIGEVVIAGGMTRMPKVRRMLTDLFGRPPHTGLNPEDAAAIGAALSGGILSGDTRDMCTFDGIPLALGIETVGGAFTPLIARNSFMPITRSLVFSTTENNQESASIRVYQGNGMKTADGVFLGQLDLTGIRLHGAAFRRFRSPWMLTITVSCTPRRSAVTPGSRSACPTKVMARKVVHRISALITDCRHLVRWLIENREHFQNDNVASQAEHFCNDFNSL